MPLDKLKPSLFYNILADGKPAEKALALLHFTQRGNCKHNAHGSASSQNAPKVQPLAMLQSPPCAMATGSRPVPHNALCRRIRT